MTRLNELAARALSWKKVLWGAREVYVQAYGENRFRCNVADWNPFGNPAQAYEIMERHDISVAPSPDRTSPHGGLWRAEMLDGAWIAHGDTPAQAITRCLILNRLDLAETGFSMSEGI